MFHKDFGMRIDLVLASPELADRLAATLGGPAGAQGQGAERPRAGRGGPGRGPGRRHRPGRTAAVRLRRLQATRPDRDAASGALTAWTVVAGAGRRHASGKPAGAPTRPRSR